jgi:hypothetical protein
MPDEAREKIRLAPTEIFTPPIDFLRAPSPPITIRLAQHRKQQQQQQQEYEEEELIKLLETPYQLEPPINRLKRVAVDEVFYSLNPKKSSGYDLIAGKII